jgi:hypothetical protein
MARTLYFQDSMDWLHFGLDLVQPMHWLAQTSPSATPTTAPTADELALIKQQMTFLKDANASLAASFDRYIKMVQLTLATAGGIVGVVAFLGAALSIKSLRDFYDTLRSVEGKVREAVDQEVSLALRRDRRRLNRLEAILAREDIPERISIEYLVPTTSPQRRQKSLDVLLEILERRGFNAVLRHEPNFQDPNLAQQQPMFNVDIVVLDLHHAGIDQDKDKANTTIKAVSDKMPFQQSSLVVYGSGQYSALWDLITQEVYCGASNGPLTFVARVLEAAYVADAIKLL